MIKGLDSDGNLWDSAYQRFNSILSLWLQFMHLMRIANQTKRGKSRDLIPIALWIGHYFNAIETLKKTNY